MFDFEKLELYQLIKISNNKVLKYILTNSIPDKHLSNELRNSTLSIQLNLAEGTGRFLASEKKHFFTTARSSVFACVAILDILRGQDFIDSNTYSEFYNSYEQISKMLLGMYRNIKEE
ncbi:MAG: four helix bundle protein [Saprospiraceae bacterium]|nr:four helix bundle protein [Saprospiraceae bacterium]